MSQLLSLLGWTFLPGFAASTVQRLYYALLLRPSDPKPAPGSASFRAHRRVIYVLVVASYLLYTIVDAHRQLRTQSSFYEDLGLPVWATERDIRSRFRRLAALHHPDKIGLEDPNSGSYFIHLKLASDTLQDAVKRFAYERFGPEVVAWDHCVTVRDVVRFGIMRRILPHYAVAATVLYGLGLFGYMDFANFYRWLLLLALCLFEVHAATRPTFPSLVTLVNTFAARFANASPYLPFQVIHLARSLSLTFYVALSHIGPLLVEQTTQRPSTAADEKLALHASLEHLEALAFHLAADSGQLVNMELAPYKSDADSLDDLQGKMQEWLVQNTIRADPLVRDVFTKSCQKIQKQRSKRT